MPVPRVLCSQHRAQEHREDRSSLDTGHEEGNISHWNSQHCSSLFSQHLLTHKSLGVEGKVGVSAARESESLSGLGSQTPAGCEQCTVSGSLV